MGRMMRQYLLPLTADFQFTEHLKHDPSARTTRSRPGYLAVHGWLVGSPARARQATQMYKEMAGFGTLLDFTFDYADDPELWSARFS